MSNEWQQLFNGRGSIYALNEKTKALDDRGINGVIIMLLNTKMWDARIKWEKDKQEIWFRLISSKLMPKGEHGFTLKAWTMSTMQQEMISIRFTNPETAIQFAQNYRCIPPIAFSKRFKFINDQYNSNTLSIELLKDIKDNDKSLVSGYVRMHQILNNLFVPPYIVNYIILYLFLQMIERFNVPGLDYPISVSKTIDSDDYGWLNVTGLTIIEPNSGIYKWEFKTNRIAPFVIIGIIPRSKSVQINSNGYPIVSEHNSIVSDVYKGNGWHLGQGCFYTSSGDSYIYGTKLKHEISFIKMIFDTNEMTLQYETKYVDSKYCKHGIAHTVKSEQYVMAISLFSSCTIVLSSYINYFST